MAKTVANSAIAVSTQSCASQPRLRGARAATLCSNGSIHGRLRLDSMTNTNLTTTQVNQIGNSVSRPVRNSRCRRLPNDGDADMARL